MFETPSSERWIGRFAWVMAWVGVAVGQLHAMARHNTADGREDLQSWAVRVWSDPGRRVFAPLLEWADPDTVYLTYGKLWLPVFLSFTLAAVIVRRRRQPRGFEKWAWRVALVSYWAVTVSVVLEFWTQGTGYNAFFDPAFLITLPAAPLLLLGSTLLGVSLLRGRFRPRPTAWLLTLTIPLAVAILTVTSFGSLVLPVAFAFGVAGRRIAQEVTADADGLAQATT